MTSPATDPRSGPAAPRQAAGRGSATRPARVPLRSLPDEQAWWAAAPLRAGRRDLRELPDRALAALADHYLPFLLRAIRRHRSLLAAVLGDPDDIPAEAALWLLDAVRAYDPGRGVPFAGYLAAKVPYWIASTARATAGRYLADSERGHARATEQSLHDRHRPPTLPELAAAFDETPPETAIRLRALATHRELRYAAALENTPLDTLALHGDGPIWRQQHTSDDNAADRRLLALDDRRELTNALVLAAFDATPAPVNTTGLWTLLLQHLGGYTRAELAAAGHRSTKTLAAAQQRLITTARAHLRPG